MAFTIGIQPDGGLIEITFTGKVNYEQMVETRQEIWNIVSEDGNRTALIDLRDIIWDISASQTFEFASTIKHPQGMRIALVCKENDKTPRFLETVAKNRGSNVVLYSDYADAKRDLETYDKG